MEDPVDLLLETIVPSRNVRLKLKPMVTGLLTPVLNHTIDVITTNSPLQSEKLKYLTQFITNVTKSNNKQDIVQAVNEHWNPFWAKHKVNGTENPLESVGGIEDIKTLKETVLGEIKTVLNDMFNKNFICQGSIIAVQYVLLTYLYAEASRTDETIKKQQIKLDEIKTKYIDKAFELMYEDDEKKQNVKMDMSQADINLAGVHLQCAADRIGDCMEVLQDKKIGSRNNFWLSTAAVVAASYFTANLFSGYKSLSAVKDTANALYLQQVGFTALSGISTVGFISVAVKHGWNYKNCSDLLGRLFGMNKDVMNEKATLDSIGLFIRNIERNI